MEIMLLFVGFKCKCEFFKTHFPKGSRSQTLMKRLLLLLFFFFLIVYMQMPQNIFGERLKVSSFDAKNFLLLVSYC